MGDLLKIFDRITKKYEPKVEKKLEVQSDNFIVEKEQLIGNTEQLSSSEKPNNLKNNYVDGKCETCKTLMCGNCFEYSLWNDVKPIKIKHCIICNEPTQGGSLCSDKCFDIWEENNRIEKLIQENGLGEKDLINDITYPHEI